MHEQKIQLERRADVVAQNYLAEILVIEEMGAAAAGQLAQGRDQRLDQARHEASMQTLADNKVIEELKSTFDKIRG